MTETIAPEDARLLAATASGLGSTFAPGPRGSLEAMRRLGSVQIDSINVVERAHHHVLWSRNANYGMNHLAALEAAPRRVIEYWTHACAYLPIEELRYSIPRMERIRVQGHEWFRTEKRVVSMVRDRIRAEGPLRAQDFAGAKGRAGWWDWKPAKRALEYLFQCGELVAVGREGFQKVYDLAERALPPDLDMSRPGKAEMAAHYLDCAQRALGIFAEGDVAYLRKDGTEGVHEELVNRVEDGRLVRLRAEPRGSAAGSAAEGAAQSRSREVYADPRSLRRLAKDSEARVFVLSPFDPLVIDRRRCERLFGKAYRLECYLPQPRREFGYFALPILFLAPGRDAVLAGRVDAKADRRARTLVVRRLELDTPRAGGGPSSAQFARCAAEALRGFADFNGAEAVELGCIESEDGRLERSLRAAVSKLDREAERRRLGASDRPRPSRGR